MPINTFMLFMMTVLALIITPGPDMIYVAGRALSQGGKAAVFSALGVAIGYVGHTILVTLGLASVLAASPVAFRAIQLSGAAYLMFLAVSLMRASGNVALTSANEKVSVSALIKQGILTSVLNPKGLLFYFALLPQFYVKAQLSLGMQMLVYGLLASFLCFIVYSLVGLTISRISSNFTENSIINQLLPKMSACVLFGLGLYLLVIAL